MSSLKLYGFVPGLRMQKLAAIAKVAGLNVQFENVDTESTSSDAFFKNCNPTKRTPVLDAGANGYIFESNAIIRYFLRVAESTPNNKEHIYGGSKVAARSQVDMWLDFASNELDANSYPLYYSSEAVGFTSLGEEEKKAKTEAAMCSLNGLDQWLETRTFLVGERLSGADVAVACGVEVLLSVNADFWKFKNVVRFYLTVFHSNAGFAEGLKICGRNGLPVAKPEAPKKEAPKKEAPAKKKEAAPAPADDAEEPVVEAPKKKNPLDDLPPSKFILDAWKREYSNNKDTRGGAMKWLFENFDKDGWTMWYSKYKYNEELSQTFMTSNLVRGWFQRMEGVRKYAFGIALILGTSASHEIHTFWIFRGQGPELPECVKDVEDVSLHTWRQIKPEEFEKEKELIGDFLCWDGTALPKPCLEGRCFK